jgi:hypothetical protein
VSLAATAIPYRFRPVKPADDVALGPIVFPAAARLSEQVLLAYFLFAMLLASDKLLDLIGFRYAMVAGSYIYKIHPASYLLVFSFFLSLWARGNPLHIFLLCLRRSPALAYFLGSCIFVLFYTTLRHGPSGAAFVIDTLTMPALCALTLTMVSGAARRRVMLLIFGFITFNGVLGIVESAIQRRLLPPWDFDDLTTFRGCGLFGHPLTSALITGPVIVTALAVRVRPLLKIAWLGMLSLALLSFGGRTGFAATMACVAAYFGFYLLRDLLRGRFRYGQLAGGILGALIFVSAMVVVAWSSGVGRRIFGTMAWDESAEARRICWHALDYLNSYDLMFGISPALIRDITARLGLIAIENFWLGLFLQLGVVGFVVFATGLGAGLGWAFRRAPAEGRMALPLFIFIASSNNSLATKTSALTLVLAAVIVAGADRARRRTEASALRRGERAPAIA